MDIDPFIEVAPGVLVATGGLFTTTTTVVTGPDGSCLLIDPAVTRADLSGMVVALAARGLRPVAGWSTHPHWDHLLWHAAFGDVPRYATPQATAIASRERNDLAAGAEESAPGHDLSLIGIVAPLFASYVPWPGQVAEVIVHDGHAAGHGAVFLPEAGVLVAGDMCSDVEMPIVDPWLPPDMSVRLKAYRAGLTRLAAVPGVRCVIPGHGHIGDAAEFQRRLAADFAYLDVLERGEQSLDPRITGDASAFHEEQLSHFRPVQPGYG